MSGNGSSWLDHEFSNYQTVGDHGTPVARQPILNFKGAGVVVTDNPNSTSTDVEVTGGAFVPTGTGFVHVTGGVEDAAAKLVANADVASNAAIDVTKLAPGAAASILVTNGTGTAWAAVSVSGDATLAATGALTVVSLTGAAGLVQVTGALELDYTGATFPAAGFLRTKYYAAITGLWKGMSGAAAEAFIVKQTGASLSFGDDDLSNGWTTALNGYQVQINGRNGVDMYAGGATGVRFFDYSVQQHGSIDLAAYGLATFGGNAAGTRFKTVVGPMPSFTTGDAGIWFLPWNVTPTSTNVGVYGNGGGDTVINATGVVEFLQSGATIYGSLSTTAIDLGQGNVTTVTLRANGVLTLRGANATDGVVIQGAAGTTVAALDDSSADFAVDVAVGASPAASGKLRMPNAVVALAANRNGGGADLALVTITSADKLCLGGNLTGGQSVNAVILWSNGGYALGWGNTGGAGALAFEAANGLITSAGFTISLYPQSVAGAGKAVAIAGGASSGAAGGAVSVTGGAGTGAAGGDVNLAGGAGSTVGNVNITTDGSNFGSANAVYSGRESVRTNGAGTTNTSVKAVYAMPDLTMVDVVISASCKKAGATSTAQLDYRRRYYRNGGAPVAVDTPVIAGPNNYSTGVTCSGDIVASGNNLVFSCINGAADDVYWNVTMTVIPVSTPT